ncbi:ZIP family metal transporter [Atribacter laminatus]|uniref:Zinc transporter ZupT n=1 Tax=Atribacter laminatus TaxID=2847778 RepID=A0A7T1F2R3_ATRLM|nr:ZIP family metal transporter [Atribacter laminatus]QPM67585.1 Zinc transporter ZupT [Atribacter laminatus]
MNHITLGFLASLIAGCATGIGAIPVLFFRKQNFSHRLKDLLLGFAAGVMLAATAFSLLVPAIDIGGVWIAVIGVIIGALLLDGVDKVIPHEHFEMGREGGSTNLRRIWLFVLAVTIHNFPEGMAVGVSFGTENISNGLTVATAIGLQNIPEGMAVAISLIGVGYNRTAAFGYALLTGLVEPIGGLLGITLVTFMHWFLPLGMALAGGAMLFVISDEVIPETHHRAHSRLSTYALMIGFIVMMTLDNLFG